MPKIQKYVKCPNCEGRRSVAVDHDDVPHSLPCATCKGEGYLPDVQTKASHVGAPAIFKLELYCQQLNDAFDSQCYLVGSALERPDWRDVDVRMIMDDEQFAAMFPHGSENCRWEFDPRWIIMTSAISEQMSKVTGLPIDFQFQPREHANSRHAKGRSALGMYFKEKSDE